MEVTQQNTTSTRIDWLIFLVSFAIMTLLLVYADEWFWLALPFVLTYLAKALKVL